MTSWPRRIYAARDFEQVVATLSPMLRARPDDVRLLKLMGYALVQQRRVEDAYQLSAQPWPIERDS